MSMRAIGLFDSGIGGLSILREIRRLLPHEDVLYFADQAHVPYGRRSMRQIRAFSVGITRFLLDRQVKLIVLACNTASAAALHHLRATFPDTPFVGMEPAVKPAAERTITGRIGVLATSATFQGKMYASLLERFAEGKIVLQQTPHGLVERIEKGDLDSLETRAILQQSIAPLLKQNIDALVLACTHYPFVSNLIAEMVGPAVIVIDPADGVARWTERLLEQCELSGPPDHVGSVTFLSTGDVHHLGSMAQRLIGETGERLEFRWDGDQLVSK
ncbi:MAG TPA: glutamate racemase [Anaerolineae bacterium]|nr:glutamate racemase [Anaerolineae bacterium]